MRAIPLTAMSCSDMTHTWFWHMHREPDQGGNLTRFSSSGTPANSGLFVRDVSVQDIYALDVDLP